MVRGADDLQFTSDRYECRIADPACNKLKVSRQFLSNWRSVITTKP